MTLYFCHFNLDLNLEVNEPNQILNFNSLQCLHWYETSLSKAEIVADFYKMDHKGETTFSFYLLYK